MTDVGTYLRDGLLSSDIGIVNLHPSKGTPLVVYMNEAFFVHMDCYLFKNFLNSLQNEMDLVYILNTKYEARQENEVLIVQVVVYILYVN